MNSRERLLTAIDNKEPDRLPCQVHRWMPYYLNTDPGCIDPWAAYHTFDFDYVIYNSVKPVFDEKSTANWKMEIVEPAQDADGVKRTRYACHTPEDSLYLAEATKDHGDFIISPSDPFFHGSFENGVAFVDQAKQCYYN